MDDEPSFELYRDIVEGSADAYLLVDSSGVIHFANAAVRVITGYEPDQIVGNNIVDFLHQDELEMAIQAFSEVERDWGSRPGDGSPARLRVRRRDGTWLPIEAGAQMSGQVLIARATGPAERGVVLRVRAAGAQDGLTRCLEALAASEPLINAFSALASSLSFELPDIEEVAIAFAWDGRRFKSTCSSAIDFSPTVVSYGTKLAEEAAIRAVARVVEVTDLPVRARDKLAGAGVAAIWVRPVAVGAEVACLIIARRVSGSPWATHDAVLDRAEAVVRLALERRRTDQQLRDAARNDHLTGLANRASFFTELDKVVDRPAPTGYAVLYLDLDGFKPVNDTWGHPAGDTVLRQVAMRVREACRPGDIVARLGGDEFAVVCPVVDSPGTALSIGRRVVAAMEHPFTVETIEGPVDAVVGVSVGVVFVSDGGVDLTTNELIDLADIELYAVKHSGGRAARVKTVPVA